MFKRQIVKYYIKKILFNNYYFLNAFKRIKGVNIIKEPYNTLFIPAEIIEYKGEGLRNRYKNNNKAKLYTGEILEGEWDLDKMNYEDSEVKFIAFKKRFDQGMEWEETGYYKYFNQWVKKHGNYKGCNNFAEFKKRYDKLYYNIKKNGLKNKKGDNIKVSVGRNGEVMKCLGEGQHRTAIAKILNINRVPIQVKVWHKKFIKKIQKIYTLNKVTPEKAIKPILENYNTS